MLGKEFVNSEGYIDRAKLAQVVFHDDAALKDLENIIHPLVRNKTNQIIEQQTAETIIVNEIPLLLEKKMEEYLGQLENMKVKILTYQHQKIGNLIKLVQIHHLL